MERRSEATEQTILFRWAAYETGMFPELALMFHVPNGGTRDPREAHNLKMQGVKSGVPDIMLPAPRGEYHGLFVELKRVKGGVVSETQKQWIAALNAQGYLAVVAHGADEAIKVITEYLERGAKNGTYHSRDDIGELQGDKVTDR